MTSDSFLVRFQQRISLFQFLQWATVFVRIDWVGEAKKVTVTGGKKISFTLSRFPYIEVI
jgi:hypothetical protein